MENETDEVSKEQTELMNKLWKLIPMWIALDKRNIHVDDSELSQLCSLPVNELQKHRFVPVKYKSSRNGK